MCLGTNSATAIGSATDQAVWMIKVDSSHSCCLQGVTLSACVAGDRSQAWEFLSDSKLRSVGVDKCLAVANGEPPAGQAAVGCHGGNHGGCR